MKSTAIMTTVLMAASLAVGQTNAAPGQSSSSAQNGAGAQAAPSGGHRMLKAQTKEEVQAYQDASAKTDPAQAEAAANDFAAKYPKSELRSALYMRTMNLYAQANNTDKVIAIGREAIAADPINPVPLVQVASALAETTHDGDLDREQKLAESAKNAQAAIDNIDTGLLVPENADPARVEATKRSIITMAYDTLGMVDMDRTDYADAITHLQKAIAESKDNPEGVLYLRLSVSQDKLKQYPQALDSANKAVQYAQAGTPAEGLAKQQQERLQKLISAEGSNGNAAAPAAMPAPMPGQQASPSSVQNTPATPH